MDVRIFHFRPVPAGKRIMKDRLNGSTGYLRCRFLEWTGWYSQDVYQRLLGHYRLFQHFRKDKNLDYRRIDPIDAYILNYRATQGVKHFIFKIISFIYSTCTREPYAPVEIEGINRILVNQGASILQQFLADADKNFEQALPEAAKKMRSSEFICVAAGRTQVWAPVFITQSRNEYNTHHNESFTEINNHLATKEGATGKEKGVFSKRQWLMLYDFLSETSPLEKIDFGRPHQFNQIAGFLHALSGKDKTSFVEELNYYKNKGGLYKTKDRGELQQLIIVVTNMYETFRDGNQQHLAKLANKKIIELNAEKKRDYPKNDII